MSYSPPDSDDEPTPPRYGQYTFKTEVEQHDYVTSGTCRFKRKQIACNMFEFTRSCKCGKEAQGKFTVRSPETHYSRDCRWRKIKDQKTNRVYLARRCVCQRP
ncbi:uncharacterized protein [Watersipora subatra]|uniref:uncharacterized protein n=1 Tax=Watersipora subatra TaxID=2589382 RepID=UPI00355BF1A4